MSLAANAARELIMVRAAIDKRGSIPITLDDVVNAAVELLAELTTQLEVVTLSAEMACQGGPDDCDCCGCQLAAEIHGSDKG